MEKSVAEDLSVLEHQQVATGPKPLAVSRVQGRERRRRKIAFFGHFDSSNFGNESTLKAILYHLHRFHPDAEVTCISTGRPEASGINTVPMTQTIVKWQPQNLALRVARTLCIGIPSELYRWANGLTTLRRIDTFIIPGTGLLTDAYGLRGWGPYNTFKWSVIAKICRCKIIFVSVGAGPIYGALGRRFVKSALSLADFRSYRDKSTIKYLISIGYPADNDRMHPDLVFSLPIPKQGIKKGGRPVVGLGLMEYAGKYSVSEPRNEIYLAYLENLVIFVRWLLAHKYDVRLLSGDTGDMHVREELKDLLLREGLSARDEGRIIDEPVTSVDNLLSQISATDIIVATRFHNVVLALLCNKPAISMSFHHKSVSLMSAMGLSEYCLDINDFKAEMLIAKFCDLKTNVSKLKPLIREKVREFRDALDEQYRFIFNEM